MRTEKFQASVQYGDYKGTACADGHDRHTLQGYIKEKGLVQEGELIVGISMFSGEVHGRVQDGNVSVSVLVADVKGFDAFQDSISSGEDVDIREICLDMRLEEFFGFFKRFKICVSSHGVIDGVEIRIAE
ncbi:hypothetical protein RVX_R25580 [Nitratidesulfovibrio sp. HK-II]|uniref:hypothetical protein n=1 Tax=Nitratidesulfovibrio sp. HK-II TaxID=2009266 RepID=UPI0011C02050|nr:hypothetical protein [Nitratidesulfovibrio sp. HK-II]